MPQRHHTVCTLPVEGNRGVRAIAQDALHQTAQHGRGSDFDKSPDAILIHAVHHLVEADGTGDLVGEAVAQGGRVHRVQFAIEIRVERQVAVHDLAVFQMFAERTGRGRDQRRMEGRGNGQADHAVAVFLQQRLGFFDGHDGAGKHRLAGAVQIRDRKVDAPFGNPLAQLVRAVTDGQHAAGRFGGDRHELAAFARDVHHGVEIGAAGGVERGDFAEAVAADAVGRDFQLAQNVEQRRAGGADGGLGPLGLGQAGGLGAPGFVVVNGRREDGSGEPGRPVPCGLRFRKSHGDVGGHAGVLAALPGEHERRAAGKGAGAGVDTWHGAIGGIETLFRVGGVVADGGETERLRGIERLLRIARQFGQIRVGGFRGKVAALLIQGVLRIGSQQDQFSGGVPVPGRIHAFAFVLFERHVEVGAAEAERADGRAAGMILRTHPGARLRVQVERALLQVQLGIGAVHFNGGGENPVVQGHGGLEEIRRARCRLGVPDLGFDGAQRAPLIFFTVRPVLLCFAEHLAEAFEFGRVTRHRSGAVRFHHADRLRAVAGRLVAAAQRFSLAFRHGRVNALGTAVGRGAETADHRIDPVAVAFGVFEAAQSK